MRADPVIERRFGTRSSLLALWQTNFVMRALSEHFPGLRAHVHTFKTVGDDIVDRPLPELGGKGVFTARLEHALLAGDVDIAVHSLKDLPTETTPGLRVAAIMTRADVRDAMVTQSGDSLDSLPKGSVIGTSSLRRQAQILERRPDFVIKPIRGNVETRIKKVKSGTFAATILAAAGLERLGLTEHVSEYLDLDTMLPPPGQGALAIQCRSDDEETLHLLDAIDDPDTHAAVIAERAFLTGLGGGCSAPVAAYAHRDPDGSLTMTGLVAHPDGSRRVRVEGRGKDGIELAAQLTAEALANGAGSILEEARADVEAKPMLRGRRILVTRAANQNDDLCTALTALGATPVPLPMIRVVPLIDRDAAESMLRKTAKGDWIVFTSANGVWALKQALAGDSLRDLLAGRRIAAVGPATAEALEGLAISPDFVSTTFTGESLGSHIPCEAGDHFWLFRAETAGQGIVDVLVKRGVVVNDVPVYRTESETVDTADFAELDRGVDAIMFTSGSTARNFKKACEQAGRSINFSNGTLIACIGPETARAAQALGFDVGLSASEHTTSGMVDALADYYNEVNR